MKSHYGQYAQFKSFSLVLLLILIWIPYQICSQVKNNSKPNFIIIFTDDLGYGDLGSYGHPSIATPNLDRMALEGQRWTNFYSAASVCTPSRASILTGRLSVRNGMASHARRVLFPDSKFGLPSSEITLAGHLKKAGYTTGCIGKWHLGHKEAFLPLNHGFDYYFGIPYSNDMDRVSSLEWTDYWKQEDSLIVTEDFNVPLIRNTLIVERPADQNTITRRYTEETIRFIAENKDRPFFIYLAHSMPHIPLFVSDDFRGKSRRGLYGDVIEEIDHGVGEILDFLRSEGLDRNTIVVFTSDNGPWVTFKQNGGSAGLLRAGKGTTWEGGMRVPGIFWAPGLVKSGLRYDIGSAMDLFPTFSKLAGLDLPEGVMIDGVDISNTLIHGTDSERNSLLYYRGDEVYAVRLGDFKAHFITEGEYGEFGERQMHNPPLLYNLSVDPSETIDISSDHPEVIAKIQKMVDEHLNKLTKGTDRLAERE